MCHTRKLRIKNYELRIVERLRRGSELRQDPKAFIKDHKKDFIKFNDNHKFHMNIFTFTFDNNIPEETAIYSSLDLTSLDAIQDKNFYKDFKDSFNTSGGDANYETVSGGISAKSDKVGDIETKSEELYKKLKEELDNDTYYDLVRGRFLGQPGTRVDSVDYSKDLFEVFRDGQSGKEDHEFEYSDIQDALARFENYERIKKDLTKKKNAAEKEYHNLRHHLLIFLQIAHYKSFQVQFPISALILSCHISVHYLTLFFRRNLQ